MPNKTLFRLSTLNCGFQLPYFCTLLLGTSATTLIQYITEPANTLFNLAFISVVIFTFLPLILSYAFYYGVTLSITPDYIVYSFFHLPFFSTKIAVPHIIEITNDSDYKIDIKTSNNKTESFILRNWNLVKTPLREYEYANLTQIIDAYYHQQAELTFSQDSLLAPKKAAVQKRNSLLDGLILTIPAMWMMSVGILMNLITDGRQLLFSQSTPFLIGSFVIASILTLILEKENIKKLILQRILFIFCFLFISYFSLLCYTRYIGTEHTVNYTLKAKGHDYHLWESDTPDYPDMERFQGTDKALHSHITITVYQGPLGMMAFTAQDEKKLF